MSVVRFARKSAWVSRASSMRAGEEAAGEPRAAPVGHAHNREPGLKERRVLGEPRLGVGNFDGG